MKQLLLFRNDRLLKDRLTNDRRDSANTVTSDIVEDVHDDPQPDVVPQLDFRMPSSEALVSRNESQAAQTPSRGAKLDHSMPSGLTASSVSRSKPFPADDALQHAPLHTPTIDLTNDGRGQLPLDLDKLAHELRTPIGAIVALAEVMRDERFGALGNARYKGYANDIHQTARHALAVLSAMLNAGPGPNGHADPRGHMTFEQIELNALARGCVSGLQPVASKAGLSLRTALNPQPLYLLADRRSIKQIVLNLLSNALRFTPAGGTITVATSNIAAPLASPNEPKQKPVAGEFRLDVRDTGIGMSAALIVDLLSRDIDTTLVDNAQHRNGAGQNGIGLPMARALAEAHGGRISITSDADGSTVSLHLPSTSNRSIAAPSAPAKPLD
jgi:Histidine kinase-, DNA gyrase B-, and HSP90-like ATPase/His Kinase A (phospho-acceptor) domain